MRAGGEDGRYEAEATARITTEQEEEEKEKQRKTGKDCQIRDERKHIHQERLNWFLWKFFVFEPKKNTKACP